MEISIIDLVVVAIGFRVVVVGGGGCGNIGGSVLALSISSSFDGPAS